MNSSEWRLINLLDPEVLEDFKWILEQSEEILADTPYRLSLPGYSSGQPTLRTAKQQYRLYLQGRPHLKGGSRGSVVTWVDGYEKTSYHQTGKAIDCGLRLRAPPYSFEYYSDSDEEAKQLFLIVVDLFKARGFEWGGDWDDNHKDWNHFQKV